MGEGGRGQRPPDATPAVPANEDAPRVPTASWGRDCIGPRRFDAIEAQRGAAAAQIGRSLTAWRKIQRKADKGEKSEKQSEVSDPDEPAEKEADAVAEQVAGDEEGGSDEKDEGRKGGAGKKAKGDAADGTSAKDGEPGETEPAEISAKLEGVGRKIYMNRQPGGGGGPPDVAKATADGNAAVQKGGDYQKLLKEAESGVESNASLFKEDASNCNKTIDAYQAALKTPQGSSGKDLTKAREAIERRRDVGLPEEAKRIAQLDKDLAGLAPLQNDDLRKRLSDCITMLDAQRGPRGNPAIDQQLQGLMKLRDAVDTEMTRAGTVNDRLTALKSAFEKLQKAVKEAITAATGVTRDSRGRIPAFEVPQLRRR